MSGKLSSKTIIVAAIIIISALIVGIAIRGNALDSQNLPSESDILKAQYERGMLQNSLKVESVYPEYYTSKNILRIKDNVIKEGLLETEALKWYAQKNNINVSDNELNEYMRRLIEDSKAAEEYKMYEDAARKLNTTYEEILMNDAETYRDVLIKDKLYKKYVIGNQMNNAALDDSEREKNQNEWDGLVAKIVSQYKMEASYNSLIKEFKSCERLANDNVVSVNQIKSELKK